MKIHSTVVLLPVSLGVLATAALRAQPPGISPTNPAKPAAIDTTKSPIDGYKQWTKVNARPHEISSWLSGLCRPLTPEETAKMDAKNAQNPHLNTLPNADIYRRRYVTVYVNAVAEDAMLHQKTPSFPEGSLIVKEKLELATSPSPELLTVMRKREKGFNPTGGDWEYLVFNGAGRSVKTTGLFRTCQSCHTSVKEADYVFRSYIPAEDRSKMTERAK